MFAQTFKLVRQQNEPAIAAHKEQYDDQRREDPLRAASVEVAESEAFPLEIPADNRCNQESRDDEKISTPT